MNEQRETLLDNSQPLSSRGPATRVAGIDLGGSSEFCKKANRGKFRMSLPIIGRNAGEMMISGRIEAVEMLLDRQTCGGGGDDGL